MIDRVTELLTQQNIINNQTKLQPINVGVGGAYVFSAGDKYVAKYACLNELAFDVRRQYQKEYDFHKICSGKNINFIPEVVFQKANDDEVLIVMKKYAPIEIKECDENLQKCAMELCARINAVNTFDFNKIFHEEKAEETTVETTQNDDPYPLSLSYQNWQNLQEKFPEHIDSVLLKEMYANFDEMDSYADKLAIPETLCHGDFHPNNFLKDERKLIVCDWQGVGIGRGIGDVAFFISRGTDMGLNIDRNKLIEWYCESLFEYADIEVDVKDLHKNVAASEFGVSFRFWAQYLQTSNIDRILNIYNSMIGSYNFLLSH